MLDLACSLLVKGPGSEAHSGSHTSSGEGTESFHLVEKGTPTVWGFLPCWAVASFVLELLFLAGQVLCPRP